MTPGPEVPSAPAPEAWCCVRPPGLPTWGYPSSHSALVAEGSRGQGRVCITQILGEAERGSGVCISLCVAPDSSFPPAPRY